MNSPDVSTNEVFVRKAVPKGWLPMGTLIRTTARTIHFGFKKWNLSIPKADLVIVKGLYYARPTAVETATIEAEKYL